MKNLAILAAILTALSTSVNAESAVSEVPTMTLALNSGTFVSWLAPAKAVDTDIISSEIAVEVNQTMDRVSAELEKKLEEKIAKELEYAMY